jgi:hypothetical protein
MSMTVREALTIMELMGQVVTRKAIKDSYRKLASRYHPDRNAAGLRKMQDVNSAYDCLAKVPDYVLFDDHSEQPKARRAGDEPDIQEIKSYGLHVSNNPADLRIWVTGKTFAYKERLKRHGFRWCPERKAWWRYK